MKIFNAPLPRGNYGTLIVSTAGHWTSGTFEGLWEDKAPYYGTDKVMELFEEAMKLWAAEVQGYLDKERPKWHKKIGSRRSHFRKRVLARAYTRGHQDCHDHKEPWTKEVPLSERIYNWNEIEDFNRVFKSVLSGGDYPDIRFLHINHPALLRPDAHAAGDCLHIMAGAGVIEGWTHYIWHYLTHRIVPHGHRFV